MDKEKLRKYNKKYKKQNRDKVLEGQKKYREKHGKRNRDKIRFGGNREKALKRDNYLCKMCGKTHHEVILNVHHKDGSGKNAKVHNNRMNNLITLCHSCHMSLHKRGKTWKWKRVRG